MLVKLDVAIEFAFATSAGISFSSFRCYSGFFLLLRQFFRFLLELVFDLKLMFSHEITLLCFFGLCIPTASLNI